MVVTVTAWNQTNKNVGIKDNVDAVPTQQYILLPLLYDSPQSSKDAVADDAGKKTNEEPANEGKRNGQKKERGASNKEDDQNVFTNADDLPTDSLMPDLEVTADLLNTDIFSGAYDNEDVGAEADLNNLETTVNVEKDLYGLHHAPRAWYETLSTYLLENGFRRWIIDKTLFIKKNQGDILLVQVYVDHIIFGSTKKSLCTEFKSLMHKKFQMSSMGELTFFLGLQVMQRDDGIFISQDKYVADILKKFDFVTIKIASTQIETNKALLKDEEAEEVDVHLYRSMIGLLMYLIAFRPDIMFVVCACARFQVTPKVSHLHAVKRIFRYFKVVANSTTKAEYVAAANCCRQVLWIQNQMLDYGFNFMNTKIYIDNESTIYETVINEWEDRMERAATTASSLEAEQDSSNINRTQSMATLNESFPQGVDSGSGPRVNTLGSGEDNMKLKKLMEHYTQHYAQQSELAYVNAARHNLLLLG
ncbi:putative ribonuclease H-like domain-containing protein [Tanacetum coccineum]